MSETQEPKINSRLQGRGLTEKEIEGIKKMSIVLKEHFGRSVFTVTVNPHGSKPDEVWGMYLAFNLKDIP